MSTPFTGITDPGRVVPDLGTEYMARLLCNDAYEAVEKAHGKASHLYWGAFKTGIMNPFRFAKKEQLVNLASAGLIVTASIVVGVATAGTGTAVIIGVGAGTYAVRKLGQGSSTKFFDLGRRNRNWLSKHRKAHSVNVRDWARALTSDASSAIRHAVDHYRNRGMHLTPETPTYSMRGCGGLPADAGGV